MPNEIYLQALGILVDSLMVEMIEGLEALADISEEETHQLHGLLSMMYKCETFFHSAPKLGTSTGEGEERLWWVKRYVLHWTKYVKVTNILEEKLVVIADDYEQGLLFEFTAEEVHHLLRALFSDSPLRREQLARIK